MSNHRSNMGQGQSKPVPGAVPPRITPVEDVPKPEKSELKLDLPPEAAKLLEGSQSTNHIPINMPTDDAQTLALKRRLLVAQTKLLDIERILKNDHYQVGYLVDAGPIKTVLKRPEE